MLEQSSGKINKLIIPIAIIVAGVIIAGAVYFSVKSSAPSVAPNNGQGQKADQPIVPQQPSSVDISKVKIEGSRFAGNPNAPVVMAYWGDFQCPFCKRLEETVVGQILKDYPDKVKIVIKDFQFLGADSQTAGWAARAVWEVDPEKYFEWHMAMYNKQDGENSDFGNKEDIVALTKTILGNSKGNKVAELMVSKQAEYQKAMDEDKAEGQSFGINGTPDSIIGKDLISGAQPYSAFKQIIDLALQGK
ncbi:MAG: thioredoxin domain-containing protein [Candidatus Staskawiczbacteria bacterium]|nr:thioredoxin domain-containing protein [Candidatus Staskawiczbacteria bacterium]